MGNLRAYCAIIDIGFIDTSGLFETCLKGTQRSYTRLRKMNHVHYLHAVISVEHERSQFFSGQNETEI